MNTKGEGLFGLVLGTSNLETFKKKLNDNGIETGSISDGKGFEAQLNLTRTWKNLFFDSSITRDLFVFPIEHVSGKLPSAQEDKSQVSRLDARRDCGNCRYFANNSGLGRRLSGDNSLPLEIFL